MTELKKIVQGGLKVLAGKVLKRNIPFEINIHITDKCNMHCTYCYSNFYKRKTPEIPKERIFAIVDAFQELGAVEVSLIGGEPLIHSQFDAIVDYIKSRGLFCSAVTNGWYLPRHMDTARKLDMVCVSLDGPREINDITRGEGSHQKAVAALELLQQAGINRQLRCTLQKHNLHAVEQVLEIGERYGANVNFGLLFPQSSDAGDSKIVSGDTPQDTAYKDALRRIIAMKRANPARFFNSMRNFENALNWPTSYQKFFLNRAELRQYPHFRAVPCYGGRTFATIDTDGRLYPCTNLIGFYDAPNVLEMDIKEAWHRIKDHDCSACFYLSSVEKNLISDLDPGAILNFFRVKRLR
ncbi:MAG: radical SAM protein [Magnetococcales bacterium]|nr:radical SAM protein [Magnetococcales bacterium]